MRMKREDGQAMVEFALILPILIFLICNIIDFSWIFGNQIMANNAAREAARSTAIHYSDYTTEDPTEIARGIVENKAPKLSIAEFETIENTLNSGDDVTVSFSAIITVLTPISLLGDSYTLHAKSVMRLE